MNELKNHRLKKRKCFLDNSIPCSYTFITLPCLAAIRRLTEITTVVHDEALSNRARNILIFVVFDVLILFHIRP